MEDNRKLCEYSLQQGTTISALFEPDMDIDLEVSLGNQMQKLTVSNATTVMALKVQICGIMRCGRSPKRLEIRLGDIALEDPMPLHFYAIKDGFRLDAIKPNIRVTVENNHGNLICWHLDQKDAIKEVKAELARSLNKVSTKQMHLFIITDGQNFDELDDDDETVERCKIQDGDKLYLLTYRWMYKEYDVTVMKTGMKLSGVEKEDTCLGIKVKAQDQTGMPVSTIKLAGLATDQLRERLHLSPNAFVRGFKHLIEISNKEKRVSKKVPLSIVTEEDLKADAARVEQEREAWREELRKKGYRIE